MLRIGRWTAAAFVIWAGTAGAGGCGGLASDAKHEAASDGVAGASGASSNATSEPVSIETFGDELDRMACDWLVPCCVELDTPVTATGCANCLSLSDDPERADPNNYSFDPNLAAECLAAAREIYGALDCDLDSGEYDAVNAEIRTLCDSVFRGKLEPGAHCAAHVECARAPGDSVECTDFLGTYPESVCVVRRQAAEGEPCFWSCTGNECWGSSGLPPPGLQGQCDTDEQLYCEDGVCVRQPVLGEPCTGSGVCVESMCEKGVCTLADRVTCENLNECDIGYYCESTRCAPAKPAGAPCAEPVECETGICSDNGSCIERPPTTVANACSNLALWN